MRERAREESTPQLGTLGAGNHYAEIQCVDAIYDKSAAAKMGIEWEGQVTLTLTLTSIMTTTVA